MPVSRSSVLETRYQIAVSNSQKAVRLTRPRLIRIARGTLAAEKVTRAEISIAIVDDPQIHEVNRQYLQHDYPTDVISFLLEVDEPVKAKRSRGAASKRASPRGAGKVLSGEIIISAETAARDARRFGWRAGDEVCLYLVHGLLHLCGYDDLTPDERRIMRTREAAVLAEWGLIPRYDE